MKHFQQKKLRPYFIGVGALALIVGISIYMQWQATQQLYFTQATTQVEEQNSPSLEVTEKSDIVPVEEEKPTVDKSSEEETPTVSVAPPVDTPTEPADVSTELMEEVPAETMPEQAPDNTPPSASSVEVDQLVAEATGKLQQYQAQFVGSLEALYTS